MQPFANSARSTRSLGLLFPALLLWALTSAGAPVGAQEAEIIRPTEQLPVAPPGVSPLDAPEHFTLEGYVLDQMNRPASDVMVSVADTGNLAVTDVEGHFSLPAPVRPTDRLLLQGESFATESLLAGSIWASYEDQIGQSLVRIVRLTETFEVGPEGGVYDGVVGFEVPPGALTRSVRLRAAKLPQRHLWSAGPGLQPQPVIGVHLEPAGLEFEQPIRVSLPLPPDAPDELGENHLELFDSTSGRYEAPPDASATVVQDRLVLTLTHFSRFRFVDPNQAVERRLVDRTWDYNGDGELSAEDADLVAVLRGGTHEAAWSMEITETSTVLRHSARTRESSEKQATSGSIGVSFGPVGVEAGTEVSEETSREVLKKLGLARETEQSETVQRGPIEVPEYELECIYLLRIYDYWDVTIWRRARMSQGARDRFRMPQDDEWHYYNHEGDQIHLGDRQIYGGRYAGRWKNGRREIYLETDRFVVREPNGTTRYSCSTELPPRPEDLWRGGEELGEGDFFPLRSGGHVSVTYGGWGVLPTTLPTPHLKIECGGPTVRDVVRVRTGIEETTEREITESAHRRASRSASVSGEVPLPGGASISGSTGWEEARSRSQSFSRAYGSSLVRQEETTVSYGILNAHQHHESDHRVYKLHLLHTARFWEELDADDVPGELRRLPTAGWRWFGDRAFAPVEGDRFIQRTSGGKWYLSGPPVTTTKEVGFYLVRYRERFCEPPEHQTVPLPTEPSEAPPVETPSGGETETPGEQGARWVPQGSRVVLTGTVLADEPATGTAITPSGQRLSGVVVEVGDQEHLTDDKGRVTFTPPSGVGTTTARFPEAEGTEITESDVISPREDHDPSAPPEVDDPPRYVVPGTWITLDGGPFDGEAGGTTVTADGEDVSVLASSPTEVVVETPASAPLGTTDWQVHTEAGSSALFSVTYVRLRLESSQRRLMRGQKGTARLTVEGTRDRVCIRVTNETPQIISFAGGDTVWLETRGGKKNHVKLRFTGVSPGDFHLGAEIVGEAGRDCGKD